MQRLRPCFQDKPHFEFGIVPGDGMHILWPEVIGSIRGRYFLLTRQVLDAVTAKDWGVVDEIVPADRLLARAYEIADGVAALPPLTSRYTRMALTQRLRRLVEEGSGYGLALEGISAADVARSAAAQARRFRSGLFWRFRLYTKAAAPVTTVAGGPGAFVRRAGVYQETAT